MAITVDHIADVSFAKHFLQEEAPVNGKITVMGSTTNGNTFNVRFDDGKVNVRFASGNFFTNMFRGKTLSRLTQTLQAQYDNWLDAQAIIEAQRAAEARITGGYKDNPNAGKVAAVVDEFKAVLAKANPPNLAKLNWQLDQVAKVAALRNTLTRVELGSDCEEKVKLANLAIHVKDNAKDLDEHGKKGYILQTIDSVIDGFLQVAAQMTDKTKQVPEFMYVFNGGCMEAKSSNIQTWLSRQAGITNVAHSDESKDLAYSINAEFKCIADEVREPYIKEARKSCEAEIRAECAKQGITDEEIIEETIETKVQQLLLAKDDEIKPKIRTALETYGKFALYEALVGAKRPMTEISKDKETEVWTVTKLVDAKGEPIMKPVSAYDIDNIFSKMVDMYMEEAVTMGLVVNETRTAENITFASRADFRGNAVVALAEKYVAGEVDKAELARLVKAEIPFAAEIPDDKFAECLETALGEITALKHDDPVVARKQFFNFVRHYANAAYFDKTNDLGRLVHILASRTAMLADPEKNFLANIDGMATRCAQMMRNAYPDHSVNVVLVKSYIVTALKSLARLSFQGNAENKFAKECKMVLGRLAPNGVLFSDNVIYDLGHRAAGAAEGYLYEDLDLLHKMIQKFNNARMNWYMTRVNGRQGEM